MEAEIVILYGTRLGDEHLLADVVAVDEEMPLPGAALQFL
jgi:hypothetical protein